MVETCGLLARADHVLLDAALTKEQEDFLMWLFSDDGQTAADAMPDVFDGIDHDIFGFSFVTPFRALGQRARDGFSGTDLEWKSWFAKKWDWHKEVCNASALPPP